MENKQRTFTTGDERSGVAFYEKLNQRFKVAVVLNVIALIYCPFMAIGFRSQPAVALVMWAFTAYAVLFGVRATVKLLSLRRPMIRLGDKALIYRSISIPWTLISGLRTVALEGLAQVGIVLSESGREYVKTEVARKPLHRLAFRVFLERLGALPVPPAKGVTTEELSATIERYRLSSVPDR